MSNTRFLYLIMAVVLTVGTSLAGSFGPNIYEDLYVDEEHPGDTFADSEILWVTSVEGQPVRMVYLGFDNNFGSVGLSDPDSVVSATLRLKVTEVEKQGVIDVYFLDNGITETLTWDDRDENYSREVIAPMLVDETGEYTLDVTDLVKEAVKYCHTGCPYSLVIVAEGDTSVSLASKESSLGGPELKFTI